MIPTFFLFLAGYQEVHDGQIDKYVIGALLIFGLGSLGWRLDVLFEKYWEARALGAAGAGGPVVRDGDSHEGEEG